MCGSRRSKNLKSLISFRYSIVGIQKEKKSQKIGPRHMTSVYIGHLYFTQVFYCEYLFGSLYICM